MRQHVVIRQESYVAGTREHPKVGIFTQTHASRPPVPWGKLGVGDLVSMKWSGGPIGVGGGPNLLLAEVVRVDSLDLVGRDDRYPHVVLDHQRRQFLAVDQDDASWQIPDERPRVGGE